MHRQQFQIKKYYDVLIIAFLLLLSLIVFFQHWLILPPGISGDASRLGLYTFDFLQEKLVPFYVYHLFAPNPLIIYLQAPVFAALGFNNAALRGVTIIGGALTAPVIYLASRWLFKDLGYLFTPLQLPPAAGRFRGVNDYDQGVSFARRVGLIAALGLALSTFFASFSRYGTEHALLPVVELITVFFLWRGFRKGKWVDFVLAGIFVGISQYVYIVARFFPIALAAASVGAILANRQLLSRWRGLVLAAISATLVALPQWILFITHPYTFTARTQQTAGQFIFALPDPLSSIATKLINQLLMLGWYWDNAYNPFSYKSLLTPVLAVALIVGVATTFYKRREAHIFSFVMMMVMLLPDLLAYEGVNPSATRLLPALPFIFIMAALGAAGIWNWLDQRPGLPAFVGYLVPLLVLVFGLARQWDYANRVKPQVLAAEGLEWQTSLVEIAEANYIISHLDTPILLPSSEYQRAPLVFLLAEQFPHRASGVDAPLTAGEMLTVIQTIAPDRPTTEGIPAGYIPDEWVLLKEGSAYFLPPIPNSITPTDNKEFSIRASNNVPVAKAFSARWQGKTPEYTPLTGDFANHLRLIAYHSDELSPGHPLLLTLYWQPTQKIAADLEVFVQLLNQNHNVVAGIHSWPLHGAFRIRAWHPGEIMPLSYNLPIPENLSPGSYQLIAGAFDLMRHQPIPLSTGESFYPVATLKIPLPPDSRTPETPVSANFGNIIALRGYTLNHAADTLNLRLFWQAIDAPQSDYTAFVHIIDDAGQIIAQSDAQPLGGQYPTSIWSLGETITDERVITGIASGAYQIYVGWYRWDTLERLPIISEGQNSTEDRFLLEDH